MSTTACPNCGKPVRAGARFCGNCGATLPAPARQAAPPPPSEISCPHCGKPVRQGARFCSSCGQTVDVVPAAAGEPPAEVTEIFTAAEPLITTDTPADSPATTLVGMSAAPAAATQETRRAAPAPARSTEPGPAQTKEGARFVPPAAAPVAPPSKSAPSQGRRWGIGIALVGLLACLALVAGGYFMSRQIGGLAGLLPGGKAPTVAALAPQATTPVVAAAVAATIQPTLPPTAAPPAASMATSTAEPQPTATAVLGVTATLEAAPLANTSPLSSTLATAPSATSPITGTALVPVVLFEDTFDNGLAKYWRTWGSPIPLIDRGPGDYWLSLKSLDVASSGGVTSRRDFVVFNEPGAEIEFEAQLDTNYPRGILLFDWDPLDQFDRGPDNNSPGLIHLEVHKDQVLLQTSMSGEKCSQEINGQVMHTYTLRVLPQQAVQLSIDGQPAPLCNIADMGLDPMAGSISFSGLGWVTRVKVSLP